MNVRLIRLLLPILLLPCMINAEDNSNGSGSSSKGKNGCSTSGGRGQCSRSEAVEDIFLGTAKARKRRKRTVTLPNATFLVLQSRLIVPQLPVGVYLVWVRLRLVVRTMFTETTL